MPAQHTFVTNYRPVILNLGSLQANGARYGFIPKASVE
jgi:hypothetical protein